MHTLQFQSHTIAVCATCGSDDVSRTAEATWDVSEQTWELITTYDDATCNKCDGECTIEDLRLNHREGWDLFDYDGSDLLQIQMFDGADIFKTDAEAVAYVRERASDPGRSPRHAEAILTHDTDAPAIAAYERNLRGSI